MDILRICRGLRIAFCHERNRLLSLLGRHVSGRGDYRAMKQYHTSKKTSCHAGFRAILFAMRKYITPRSPDELAFTRKHMIQIVLIQYRTTSFNTNCNQKLESCHAVLGRARRHLDPKSNKPDTRSGLFATAQTDAKTSISKLASLGGPESREHSTATSRPALASLRIAFL